MNGRKQQYLPITAEQLIEEQIGQDDRYRFYRPLIPLQIFHCLIPVEDMENCTIGISVNYELPQMLSVINNYLEWITTCEKQLVSYVQERLKEELPKDWFQRIEVWSASFIFNTLDDYGATIAFSESIFEDHILEIDFEKDRIVADRLNG